MNGEYRRAHQALREYFVTTDRFNMVVEFFALLVFPAVEGILWEQDTFEMPTLAWIIIYIIHVVLGFYILIVNRRLSKFSQSFSIDALEQESIKQKEQLQTKDSKVKQYKNKLISFVEQLASVQGSLSVLHGLLLDESNTMVPRDVDKVLAPIVKYRTALGFNSSEMYNFAVYLYNDKTEQLELFARNCDDRIQRHNRSWRRGVGHIGIAFAQGRTIISKNTLGGQEFIVHNYDTDNQFYASFISTPIPSSNVDKPIGILVITSNRPDHFDDQHKIIAETIALILSIYIAVSRKGPQ